ncbi:MAG TPA: hypothetical protein VH370_09880 [Humisphaera sp.]|nr:hypothetical protein [Humisphaera sp.]
MTITFQQWMQQGETLYQAALKEVQSLKAQLDEIQARLVSKQAEVKQMEQLLGKAPSEPARRLSATAIVPAPVITSAIMPQIIGEPDRQVSSPSNNANIARALTGKSVR